MGETGRGRPHIVLTGATGFIGRHLQRTLCDNGYDISALVRPGSANTAHVLPDVRVRRGALDAPAFLDEVLSGADFVVYAAGAVRGRCVDDFWPANVAGVASVAAAAARVMTHPRIILISSLAASKAQLSDYAASKRAGEDALRACAGIEWTILRPPAVYGPGDREMRPLFTAIRRGLAVIVGPQGQRLSLLHAADLARAVAAIIDGFEHCVGACYELDDGHPQGYGWADIIAQANNGSRTLSVRIPRAVLDRLARWNVALPHRRRHLPMLSPGKVRELSEPSWLCNNQALTAATGWLPRIRLREGVAELFASPPSASPSGWSSQ
ncbi:MAG: NAD(P)-dependent oxidoreductase [Gammaproteobacteria bacterium]